MAVPEKYQDALNFICGAASESQLAALEVKQKSDGSPAFLLVAVREEADGAFSIAPLARLDVDFLSEFEAEGAEEVEEMPDDSSVAS